MRRDDLRIRKLMLDFLFFLVGRMLSLESRGSALGIFSSSFYSLRLAHTIYSIQFQSSIHHPATHYPSIICPSIHPPFIHPSPIYPSITHPPICPSTLHPSIHRILTEHVLHPMAPQRHTEATGWRPQRQNVILLSISKHVRCPMAQCGGQ